MTDSCSGTNEELALNSALEESTPILAESLQRAERERRRKRRLLLGGLVMLVVGASIVAAVFLAAGESEPPPPGNHQVQVPAELEGLEQQAWALWWQGKNEQAAQQFTEAIKLEPESAALWHGLGWSLFNGHKHEKAADAFEEALKLDKTNPGAINGMGQIAYAKRDYQQAKTWFLQAPDGGNGNVAQQTLVGVHLLLGEYEQAEALCAKLLEGMPYGKQDGLLETGRTWVTELQTAAKAGALPEALRAKIEPELEAEPEAAAPQTPTEQAEVNLLTNGGFERGTKGWIIGSNSGRMRLTPELKVKTEGKQSLKITKTGGMPIDIVRINVNKTTPGQTVDVSAMIKADDAVNAWMKFYVWDAEGNVLIEDLDVTHIHGTYGWKRAGKRFTMPDNAEIAAIQFWVVMGATVWIDDVKVTPVKKEPAE